MIWVLLTILSATGIFVFFKLLDIYNLPNLNGIVINYLVAGLLGLAIAPNRSMVTEILYANWAPLAIAIGILFILMFFVIGYSSKVSGMSLTTLASKMSVVIPILFSIIYFGESVTIIKIFGLVLALFGLVLAVYKKRESGKLNKQFLVPIVLFLGMGFVDSLVKFAQETYVSDEISSVFTALLFFVAFFVGLLIMLAKPKSFKAFKSFRLISIGVGLGIVNFGSIYFLIRALNSNVLDSSVIFGINNIGIIALSTMIGFVFFRERLTRLNWTGLLICIAAIAVLYITK